MYLSQRVLRWHLLINVPFFSAPLSTEQKTGQEKPICAATRKLVHLFSFALKSGMPFDPNHISKTIDG